MRHGHAAVRRAERGHVVHAVAHHADAAAGGAQRGHDFRLLCGGGGGEHPGVCRRRGERLVGEPGTVDERAFEVQRARNGGGGLRRIAREQAHVHALRAKIRHRFARLAAQHIRRRAARERAGLVKAERVDPPEHLHAVQIAREHLPAP